MQSMVNEQTGNNPEMVELYDTYTNIKPYQIYL